MKKVVFSLFMAVAFLPMIVMGQVKGDRVFVNENKSACGSFTWIDGTTYSSDTVATYTSGDTVYVLNLTMMHDIIDTAQALEVTGACSYTRNDKTWKESGTYLDTIVTASGCDSIVKINVTLLGIDSTNQTVTECDTFMAPWGEVLTMSGDYDTTLVVDGCSRHDILHLTINYSVRGEVEEAQGECEILWNGKTIREEGLYEASVRAANGCDSILTIQVTAMTHVSFDTLNEVACDLFVAPWGDTIRQSGTYSNLDTTNGCSATTTLQLVVYQSYRDTIVNTVEAGCSYNWNGTLISDTLIHYAVLKTVEGNCDSLAAIQLSLSGVEYDTTNATLCGNTTYSWHGNTYSAATQADATETSNTCESHYHLNLVVGDNYDTVVRASCVQYIYTYDSRTGTPGRQETATFTESGLYTTDADGLELLSKHWSTGCITHHALDLTIVQPQLRERRNITEVEACDSYVFVVGRTRTDTLFTDTTLTLTHYAHGTNGSTNICYDSVGTLQLTIKHGTNIDTTVVVCDTFYWDITDQYYTRSTEDQYRDTVLNEVGCPIRAKLHLTVNYTPEVTIDGNLQLTPGQGTTLTAISNMNDVRYAWYKGTSSSPESTTNSLTLETVNDNTDIHLVTTSSKGCVANNWVTVTANLGVDQADELQVMVYPNPTSKVLYVDGVATFKSVILYNLNGQVVLSKDVNASSASLELDNLSAGNYILTILSENGEQASRKVIVSK